MFDITIQNYQIEIQERNTIVEREKNSSKSSKDLNFKPFSWYLPNLFIFPYLGIIFFTESNGTGRTPVMHLITIEYDFVFQIDEDCVIVGPVGENDPVEELWKHCEPVQQDDGFGTQVVCLKVKG